MVVESDGIRRVTDIGSLKFKDADEIRNDEKTCDRDADPAYGAPPLLQPALLNPHEASDDVEDHDGKDGKKEPDVMHGIHKNDQKVTNDKTGCVQIRSTDR